MDGIDVGFQQYLSEDLHEYFGRDGSEEVALALRYSATRGALSRHCLTPGQLFKGGRSFVLLIEKIASW
jgi:hypothetical protein